MESHEVMGWFASNETRIVSIGDLMEQNRCISKVGYVSLMPSATFACYEDPANEVDEIHSILKALGVKQVTSHTFEDGNFVVSILINSSGISVSGSGLRIVYWKELPEILNRELECEALIPLQREGWYVQKLSSGDVCL